MFSAKTYIRPLRSISRNSTAPSLIANPYSEARHGRTVGIGLPADLDLSARSIGSGNDINHHRAGAA